MHVKFMAAGPDDLKRLEDFLEEKKHILDIEA
jgi:hypothetical protein